MQILLTKWKWKFRFESWLSSHFQIIASEKSSTGSIFELV